MAGPDPDPSRRMRAPGVGRAGRPGRPFLPRRGIPAVAEPAVPRRDRRGRGLRTPLLPADIPASRTRSQRFDQAVLEAVADLEERWPGRLQDIEFAVDEVPAIPGEGAVAPSDEVVLDGGVPLTRFMPPGIDSRGRPTWVIWSPMCWANRSAPCWARPATVAPGWTERFGPAARSVPLNAPAQVTVRSAAGSSSGTICLPSGASEIGISLKFAMASGIPMMVMHNAIPVTRWPMVSHSPGKMNQMTLAMKDGAPAPGLFTIVRPNGQRAKPAIRNEATPNGIVMMKMQTMMPVRT